MNLLDFLNALMKILSCREQLNQAVREDVQVQDTDYSISSSETEHEERPVRSKKISKKRKKMKKRTRRVGHTRHGVPASMSVTSKDLREYEDFRRKQDALLAEFERFLSMRRAQSEASPEPTEPHDVIPERPPSSRKRSARDIDEFRDVPEHIRRFAEEKVHQWLQVVDNDRNAAENIISVCIIEFSWKLTTVIEKQGGKT